MPSAGNSEAGGRANERRASEGSLAQELRLADRHRRPQVSHRGWDKSCSSPSSSCPRAGRPYRSLLLPPLSPFLCARPDRACGLDGQQYSIQRTPLLIGASYPWPCRAVRSPVSCLNFHRSLAGPSAFLSRSLFLSFNTPRSAASHASPATHPRRLMSSLSRRRTNSCGSQPSSTIFATLNTSATTLQSTTQCHGVAEESEEQSREQVREQDCARETYEWLQPVRMTSTLFPVPPSLTYALSLAALRTRTRTRVSMDP